MDWIQTLPSLSIILPMMAAVITAALRAKAAKLVNLITMLVVTGLSLLVLLYTQGNNQSFIFVMGSFPAPWGNELRAGILEAGMALFFCIIMIISVYGGSDHIQGDIAPDKVPLFYIMTNLLLSSLMALVYTNDLFTAYVFVEINTIAACGLIVIKQTGRTIGAATRYMIMSLLGSGMLLMGISILYDITGHLLMSNIKETISQLVISGQYNEPLTITIGLICVGLAIKSALYPFHFWLPDAYGYSTVSSAAMLSSLVSKGYLFLLIKIFYRVIGFDVIHNSSIIHILFAFGVLGMIMGSISAIRENDIRRMIAFSSVAQIGYIYMGFGLGTFAGMVASIFHILAHAATKSLLFVAASGLRDASGGSVIFKDLTGSGYRNKMAGVAFTVGSLSMVGIPIFSGFISKLLFAQASLDGAAKMLPALIALAVSTILNAIYFMKTVIRIYTPIDKEKITFRNSAVYVTALLCFMIMNVLLGMNSSPIVTWIEQGLRMFE